MNFLDRNILPKFQERLDLASQDLNDMEDIYVTAINELAGRIYILNNIIPKESRPKYSTEVNSLLLDTIDELKENIKTLNTSLDSIKGTYDDQIKTLSDKYLELEKRLNSLDDAAARKDDMAVIYKRTTE